MKKFVFLTLFLLAGGYSTAFSQIVINEVMASNGNTISDENGDYDDWVEIYNAGDVSVNFGGIFVSDDPEEPQKWQIPANQSASTTIAPGSFMILWFDEEPGQGALHVGTKLSADGEFVILTDQDGMTRIDSVQFGEQTPGISWGRTSDGTGPFDFLNPTPEATNNGSGLTEQAAAPFFSLESGFYSGSQVVGISSPSEDVEIRYTTDGSIPTESSTLYQSPVSVDSSVILRAIAFEPGRAPSDVFTNTYLFEESHTLPVVSFVMEPDSLWDNKFGMYAYGDPADYEDEWPYFGANFWEEWEYPVHLEYLSLNGSVEFEFSAGAGIGGNFSRAFNKKSFIINNNESYGVDELEYELFPENDYDEYDGFGLRAGAEERSRLLNELMYTINSGWNHANAMQAYEPVVLYINGKYWGIYNLQERKNDDFVESRYGYDKIDMIKDYDEVKDGDYLEYEDLLNNFRGETLSGDAFFAYADSVIDLQSFTDHWIYQVYSSHGDPNNLRYWRPRETGGKWHYISHDFDWWRNLGVEPASYYKSFTYYLSKEPAGFWLLGRMMENPAYRELFLNRLGDMLNTAFKPEYVTALIDSIDAAINPEMPRDIERWSEGWEDIGGPTNYDMEYISVITKDYVQNYPDFIYAEIKDTLGIDTTRVTLAQNTNGNIRLNSITPKIKTGDWSGVYFRNTTITLNAKPEPGYTFDSWILDGSPSGNNSEITINITDQPVRVEATFTALQSNEIVINEINYNPGENFDAGDWIELFNYSDAPIDISGWIFRDEDDEHEFIVPANTVVNSKAYTVLSTDTTAFKALHADVSFVKGEVGFGLSGSGDRVRIYNASGALVDSVEYNDEAPWPLQADGEGATLELVDHNTNNALGGNWAASQQAGGTPGVKNGTSVSIEKQADHPVAFSLDQNYPNPFNPSTNISFTLPKASEVELTVFNILGQRVATIARGRFGEGAHSLKFNAGHLTSGMYIYRIKAGNFTETRKMLLLK